MNASTADFINCFVEVVGAAVIWINVVSLWKAGRLDGSSHWPVVYFTGWDLWHLAYYNTLEQPLSLLAIVVALVANGSWLMLYARIALR